MHSLSGGIRIPISPLSLLNLLNCKKKNEKWNFISHDNNPLKPYLLKTINEISYMGRKIFIDAYKNKVLSPNSSNFLYISFFYVNFENLTVKFHVPYVLNIHIKFHLNQMLFTIRSINVFFIHNFKLQKLETLTFNWWHSNRFLNFLKFVSMKNIIKLKF